jgi:(1->4)-alpha-D-glucan 1-alpha-D-glucosylmutase
MGVMGSDNTWWLDVLENGQASDYAAFFDVEWNPIKDELKGKILIPVLENQYGNVLESGELKLTLNAERGEFSIFYHQHRFPIDPSEYPRILNRNLERLTEKLGTTDVDFLEFQSIATAFSHLPKRSLALTVEQRTERNREKEVQKHRLALVCERSPVIRGLLGESVEALNGRVGDPHSFDELHELIKAQAFRLAQWRVAADDINYRRFFDINDLAALRMEGAEAFDKTHHFVFDLVAEGKVDGLRIDHPDGLYDPKDYLCRLQDEFRNRIAKQTTPAEPIYVIVEKILTGRERLRKDWPVGGTTGYEFTNLVNGLFVDPTANAKMERIYRSFTGRAVEVSELVYASKKLVLKIMLASELSVLANLLIQIALSNRHTCDFTLNSLSSALAEVIAAFPVYRTYVSDREVTSDDRRIVQKAVVEARRRSNLADLTVFDFIQQALLIELGRSEPAWYRSAVARFAMKFQQLTSAVMAKGLEDTAFYRYHRLVSLNEVGGDPYKFGNTVEEFHSANEFRLNSWPHSMLASSTHDSKRSEDVRARIDALSEIPAVWRLHLRRWRAWNRGKRRLADGVHAPSRNDEYLLYQTLVGTWPAAGLDDARWGAFAERIEQYMLKTVREAKENTSWANPNPGYEEALAKFTRAILGRRFKNKFLEDFSQFQLQTARIGMFNSLAQSLLKMTSPGVPDFYQGTELWHFTLVDPDNRHPVDYDRRRKMLEQLQSSTSRESCDSVLKDMEGGSIKLYMIQRTLQMRKKHSLLFQQGRYIPLKVIGEKSEHLCVFAREFDGRFALVAVPRLCGRLLGDEFSSPCNQAVWGNTEVEIPDGGAHCYHQAFSGECIPVEGAVGGGKDFCKDDLVQDDLGGDDHQKTRFADNNLHKSDLNKNRATRFLPAALLFRDFPVALLLSESLS